MDPVGAFLIALLVFVGGVNDWFADLRDRVHGDGRPRHERRMQQRAQEHELRKQAQEHWHAQRLAGAAGPTISEALADRIRRGPTARDQMGPARGWWHDACSDRLSEMTRQRREREARAAAGEQWWQKQAEAARRRARRYWEDTQARREEKRRKADIPDAEWWENEPAAGPEPAGRSDDADHGTRPGPDPQPSTPGAGGGRTTYRPDPEPDAQRPGPVRATAERIDQQDTPAPRGPLEIEPGWPDDGSGSDTTELLDPGSTSAIETSSNEGAEPMGALVPTTKAAIGREARSAARHHPAARAVRTDVGNQLSRTVGEYSVGEINDTVALAAAWTVALRDKLDDLYEDLAGQKIGGPGMQKLRGAINDMASAVTELHGAKGGFEFQERVLEEVGHALQQAGIGSVKGSFAQDHIH